MACHPCRCISGGFSFSRSNVSLTRTPSAFSTNSTVTSRPSLMRYSIAWLGTIRVYVPSKSKPSLPSLDSMRAMNLPPSRRSTALFAVCQSSCAVFHCLMSAGLFHASHTGVRSAFTRVSTVVFMDFSFHFVSRTVHPGIDSFSYRSRDGTRIASVPYSGSRKRLYHRGHRGSPHLTVSPVTSVSPVVKAFRSSDEARSSVEALTISSLPRRRLAHSVQEGQHCRSKRWRREDLVVRQVGQDREAVLRHVLPLPAGVFQSAAEQLVEGNDVL